ncbi:hypothetical protein K0B03_04510 [Patescibacteria group bacterium]|nr:hypothetical protein [Patescibacteria group bacterium]
MTRKIGTLGAVDENISGAGINKILIFGIAVMAIALLISVVANTGGSTGLTAKILGDSNLQPPSIGADTGNLNLAENQKKRNRNSGYYFAEASERTEKIPRYPAKPSYGMLNQEYEMNSLPYAIIYTGTERILNNISEGDSCIRITHFEVDEKAHEASFLVENRWQDTVPLFEVDIFIKLENGEEIKFLWTGPGTILIPPNRAVRIKMFRNGEDINSEIATIKFMDHDY